MKKIITGICLIALLAGVGAAVFAANKDTPAAKESSASAAEDSSASTDDSKVSESSSQPAVPAISVPADAEEAKLLMEVNQVILQVQKEAQARRGDQRMTAEEISALVRSRVEEVASRR